MRRILLLLWILAVAWTMNARDYYEHTIIIEKARNATTLAAKQEALTQMQAKHALYGQMETYQDEGDRRDLSRYWDWMHRYAELNRSLGNYAEAEQAYTRVIESLGNGIDRTCQRARLNRMNVWLRQGKYTDIIELIRQHPTWLPSDTRSKTQMLFLLSEALYNRNLSQADQNEAHRILRDIANAHKAKHDKDYLKALNNLGLMLIGADGELLNQSYDMLSEGVNYYKTKEADGLSNTEMADYHTILSNLALAEGRLGKYDEALAHIDKVIAWQKQRVAKRDNHYITSLWKRARILLWQAQRLSDEKMPQAVQALKTYYQEEKDYILHNFAFMTEHERLAFWAAQYELLSVCYAAAKADPKFAYEVALFVKNIQTQATFDIRHVAQQSKPIASLLNRLDTITNDSERLAVERSILKQMDSNKLYQTFARSMTMKPMNVCQKLGLKDVAIEWVEAELDGERYYTALCLDKQGNVKALPAISTHDLLTRSRYSLESSDSEVKNRIYNDSILGQRFWQEIMAGVTPGAKVYFSPTGVLSLLAVEYLPFDQKNCSFYRLTSTGVLCQNRRGNKPNLEMLIVGDLDYNEFEIIEPDTHRPDRHAMRMLTQNYVLGRNQVFKALPGAGRELDSLITILRDTTHVRCARGVVGTERFVKDNLANYDIAHFSTHGYCLDFINSRILQPDSLAQDQLMVRSGLAMSGANVAGIRYDYVEDGLLSALEISEMNLERLRLVTLSACQTAVAKMTDEEVSSISRGFKKAGAGAMIVSLCSTGDDASQIFFSKFYELLKQNKSVHEAFNGTRRYMQTAGEVEIKYMGNRFSAATMRNERNVLSTRKVNLSQSKYVNSYILVDAL